jgi:hypothetical protein
MHLLISAGIAVLILLAMKLVWYPDPYFDVIGAGRLILILVGVDVVIGPLITLIVFNTKKPELKRDLLIVALLQAAALGYGMYTVYMARPVYAVFNVDRYDVVTAAEIDPVELSKVQRAEFKSLPWSGPKIIAAKLPDNATEKQRILLSSVAGGADLYQLPQYYVPYMDMAAEAKRKAKPLATLKEKPGAKAIVDKYVADSGRSEAQLAVLPLRGKRQDMVAVLESETGKVLGFLPIDPFSTR